MLFVYALHFFLLTQAALAAPPPLPSPFLLRHACHRLTAARGLGSWDGEAAGEGARLQQSLAARRSASAEAAAARGDGQEEPGAGWVLALQAPALGWQLWARAVGAGQRRGGLAEASRGAASAAWGLPTVLLCILGWLRGGKKNTYLRHLQCKGGLADVKSHSIFWPGL